MWTYLLAIRCSCGQTLTGFDWRDLYCLKLCPFCGTESKIQQYIAKHVSDGWFKGHWEFKDEEHKITVDNPGWF